MSSSTTQTTANRQQLYRKTNEILNTNSLHFIPISLLFLLITFSASAFIKFFFSSPSFDNNDFDLATYFDPPNLRLIKTLLASSQTIISLKTLIIAIAFILFVILPTVTGIAMITYNTNHAIHRKRLTFSSTLKSLSHSYIPLLSTCVAGTTKLILVFLLFTLTPIAMTEAIKALGFHFNESILLVFLNTVASYALAFTIVFFIITWGSAAPIAVLELKSGFEPLRESEYANKSTKFRSHSFSVVPITGFGIGSFLSYAAFVQNMEFANWISILQLIVIYLLSSLMILQYAVANTVLYVQCKVAGGEDTAKTAVDGEVSGEYVSLVVNDKDDEVLHEATNGVYTYLMFFFSIVWWATIIYKAFF